MSFTRWFVYASFASGIIALLLQPTGIANATPSPTVLVADQSSGSSQGGQQDSRGGKTGTSNAEFSGKMKNNDPLNDMDPTSKMDSRPNQLSGRSQGTQQRALSGKTGT